MKHEEIFRTKNQVCYLISSAHRNLSTLEKDDNNVLLLEYAHTNCIKGGRFNAYPHIEMDTATMIVIIELL